MKKLSLAPYVGTLLLAESVKEFQRQHVRMFGHEDDLEATAGRFRGKDTDGRYTYLVWAKREPNSASLAHELSHVILHVFDRCGIDPREAGGEPFCYMLSQLLLDAS